MRTTIEDIARQAGVSTATVDRVLNGRANVSARTKASVLSVARQLGHFEGREEEADKLGPVGPRLKLDFILPTARNQFMDLLRGEIEAQAAGRTNLDVKVTGVDGINPHVLAETIRSFDGASDGIGIVALDHPDVREAIRSVASRGVKIVTIVSDIAHVPRVAYIGIDNRAAGRLAGYLVHRFYAGNGSGKVAMFSGSLSYRGHEEREMGFRHVLAEESQQLQIVEQLEMMDDPDHAYEISMEVLDRHPDLTAIYNVGAGNSGIGRALRDKDLRRHVLLIGHEATEDTRRLLLDGTLDAVIDQNPRVEAREALNALEGAITGKHFEKHAPRLQVIFRENIPEV
ncbi:LacI family DNA-binding transcriptional regulator [Aestuariivirga litoralis]|uniref:LacI family DNA-binding transcriptional regulator n=1 Tax=Aestuariivirga litoralis TaxID=2650924 RepID=UPI0018C4955F|nr:LacI family DNA-binding transcriptional regulator [Aestuariivirga litoralis]MBG1232361.1 LacI family DNA-binding transcriptional regulator [Aestuariivirga litoralis]